jgi:hypothetical protein
MAITLYVLIIESPKLLIMFTTLEDLEGRLPNVTKSFPASVILVTCVQLLLHFSLLIHVIPGTSDASLHASTSDKEGHYSCRVSTAGAWALDSRENHSCIHIYITDGTYSGWLLFNKSRNKISSELIQKQIDTALANHYGVLGEGRLA